MLESQTTKLLNINFSKNICENKGRKRKKKELFIPKDERSYGRFGCGWTQV